MDALNFRRITPNDVRRIINRHDYYFNSHYMSNIIAIRNDVNDLFSFQDKLYVFCNDHLHTEYHYYEVKILPIKLDLITQDPQSDFKIKEGQYINAFQLNKTTGTPSSLIQCDDITLVNSINEQEHTGQFNLIIHHSKYINPKSNENPSSIFFEKQDQFHHFISLCKIASRFNGNYFTLTMLNLSEF